eukprot:gene3801-7865_t
MKDDEDAKDKTSPRPVRLRHRLRSDTGEVREMPAPQPALRAATSEPRAPARKRDDGTVSPW